MLVERLSVFTINSLRYISGLKGGAQIGGGVCIPSREPIVLWWSASPTRLGLGSSAPTTVAPAPPATNITTARLRNWTPRQTIEGSISSKDGTDAQNPTSKKKHGHRLSAFPSVGAM